MRLSVLEGPDGYTVVDETSSRVIAGEIAATLLGERPAADSPALPLDGDGRVACPVAPGKILAIGLNYRDHIAEANMEEPSRPLVFAKFPSALTAHGAAVRIDPAVAERVDWEVELGVVIGRRAAAVGIDEALDYVLGYTVGNDLSARDVQFADGQWVRGKSFDGFCPVGPVVVTRDEVPDPQALSLRTRVNGEVVQESTTDSMVFGVAELIAFCSRGMTLEPGDLLLTGTPWGCGEFMDPVRCLHDGDVVEVEIDGIGTVRNAIETREGCWS